MHDLSGRRLAALLEARDFGVAQALLRSNLTGRARELQDDVLLALFDSPPPATALGPVAEALMGLVPDADGFSVLAERLEANGAALAAQAAQKGAATLDFEAQPAMDLWGGAFNGQARRQVLFDQLVKQLKIVAIVETGTFRGTSTAYMANAAVPVFSCELHPRYFYYSLLRLAGIANVRLERADSRRFLHKLLANSSLPSGPALFYLDAHWGQDFPLWEEVDLILSRHPAAVIMVDDFRVPFDSGFSYDDYGKGKCLSVSDLRKSVASRPSLFFPNDASAHETGERRGCVVLALGDIAHSIAREVPMLTELSWIDALILDGVAELRNERSLFDELKQTRADNEAQLATLRADLTRLDLRANELSSAVIRAEHAQRQYELEADNAKRDAALAREATAGLQSVLLHLHEELRLARAAFHEVEERAAEQTKILQASLRLSEERAAHADMRVAELQRSRWRRIGRRLGLARKASFEL
jgi:predicted O-methyltransferase YrrM